MSVEFLNRRDVKKSLSGKKKKKNRTKKKNILSLPEKLDVKNPELSVKNASALAVTLENLLPHAKLVQILEKGHGEKKPSEGFEGTAASESRTKRSQLFLGINSVSKGVQSNLIACVITADDITPKLMTTHLKLLCASKKVPYVSLPKFRVLTQKALGFPCIALGVKKSSADFLPVVELILSTTANESSSKGIHSDDSVMEVSPENEDVAGIDETPKKEERFDFEYLHRNARGGGRAFVPELHGRGDKIKNENPDFISLGADSEKSNNAKERRGGGAVETSTSEQRPDSRKRKRKGVWDSDPGNGNDPDIEYSMAKVMKLDSNPFRKSEKCKKLKKR